MYIESDMRVCPSKMYTMIQLLKLTCGKYFDGINCNLYTKKSTNLGQVATGPSGNRARVHISECADLSLLVSSDSCL